MDSALDALSLPNLGPGPDPFRFDALESSIGAVVYLQRDFYCIRCRSQVQDVASEYDRFRAHEVEVVSVVPESIERVREWQERYALPYPLLADATATVSDTLDQPIRFGLLGSLSDFFGRMPAVVLVDLRDGSPEIVWSYRGRSTFDRPSVDAVIEAIETHLVN